MPPVNKLEHSPLISTERTENSMRGAPVFAEEPFCFAANGVELGKVSRGCMCEFASGERTSDRGRDNDGRRLSSGWKISKMEDCVLPSSISESRSRLGRRTFVHAPPENAFGRCVGKEKMLHDLLNAPAIRTLRRTKLRLGGIERAQRRCNLTLKSFEDGVHRNQTTLHRSSPGGLFCGADFHFLRSARALFAALAFSPSGSIFR